jgi:hypothetical protein
MERCTQYNLPNEGTREPNEDAREHNEGAREPNEGARESNEGARKPNECEIHVAPKRLYTYMYVQPCSRTNVTLLRFGLWVFNATCNNISILVEETGVPRENHRPEASH